MVHGGKLPSPCQWVQSFLNTWQRESVFSSFCIQLMMVYAHTQRAILLFGQHNGAGVRTTALPNNVHFQQLVYMRFYHVILRSRYPSVPLLHWDWISQRDSMRKEGAQNRVPKKHKISRTYINDGSLALMQLMQWPAGNPVLGGSKTTVSRTKFTEQVAATIFIVPPGMISISYNQHAMSWYYLTSKLNIRLDIANIWYRRFVGCMKLQPLTCPEMILAP